MGFTFQGISSWARGAGAPRGTIPGTLIEADRTALNATAWWGKTWTQISVTIAREKVVGRQDAFARCPFGSYSGPHVGSNLGLGVGEERT